MRLTIQMAGLVPWGDYVIGWSGGVLHTESDFYDLVESVRTADSLANGR